MLSEPKNVIIEWTHDLGKILGYDVEVLQFSDDTFGLLVFTGPLLHRDYLIKDLFDFDFPSDEEIKLRIRETISEEFDGQNYTYTVSFKNGKTAEVVLIVTARDDMAAIVEAITMLRADGNLAVTKSAIVHAERVV